MRSFPWYATSLLALSVLSACSPPEGATAGAAPASASAGQPMPALEICTTCGTVRSITPVTQAGQTTGAGAVIGGIVGGVAGNQVGGGSGQQIATAAGVIGGAVLGNNIESNRNAVTYTDVTVDMDTGGQQTIRIDYPVPFGVGADVTVRGTSITLR
jgi:outer membrane lipoprotein SlyB